jgi:hypothetical protein
LRTVKQTDLIEMRLKEKEKEELRQKHKGKAITATIRNELVDKMLRDQGYLE